MSPPSCIGGHCSEHLAIFAAPQCSLISRNDRLSSLPWEAKIFARSLFTPNLWSVTFGFPKYPQTKRSLKNCCLDNIQMVLVKIHHESRRTLGTSYKIPLTHLTTMSKNVDSFVMIATKEVKYEGRRFGPKHHGASIG
jgi:hypothetical protein